MRDKIKPIFIAIPVILIGIYFLIDLFFSSVNSDNTLVDEQVTLAEERANDIDPSEYTLEYSGSADSEQGKIKSIVFTLKYKENQYTATLDMKSGIIEYKSDNKIRLTDREQEFFRLQIMNQVSEML